MNRLFVVSLWFQAIWFAAVLGQESWQWITLILGLITLGYAVAIKESGLSKVLLLGLCGIGLDWLNLLSGLLVFKEEKWEKKREAGRRVMKSAGKIP